MTVVEENLHDQEFVEYVVKSIVDRPEDVKAERTVDEMGVLITLKVNPQDLGQVIGRQGQTAKSIRTLLRVVGAKNHARVNLKIYEPEGYRKGHGGDLPAGRQDFAGGRRDRRDSRNSFASGNQRSDQRPMPADDAASMMPPVDDLKL